MNAPATGRESAEDRLIARHFRPIAKHPGALGLTDDAAFFAPPPGHEVVLKADAIVGSVHFFADDPPDLIARKALRVNLSDLASKGADPAGFLLSLAIPKEIGDEWLAAFARGLGADADEYACPLFGGDTDRSPGPIMVSIAMFGTVPAGRMVRRGGAKAGDVVMTTGTIGDAVLGLRLRHAKPPLPFGLDAPAAAQLVDRYFVPRPRNALGRALRDHANGGMDISDGLVGDLTKMCGVSGVSAEIDVGSIPFSAPARAALRAEPGLLAALITGGDDYEVLFTLPRERIPALREAAAAANVMVTEIGRIVAGDTPPRFVGTDGQALIFERTSFSHF